MAFPNDFLEEQPGSPRFEVDDVYERIERRYRMYADLSQEQMERLGYLPDKFYIDPETEAKFVSYEFERTLGYPTLVVRFEKRLEPEATYDLNDYTLERPIQLHPNFVMKWTYTLYSKAKDTPAVPAWAATATTDSDTLGSDVWRWSKTGAPSGYEFPRQSATKPGVSSYLVEGAVMTKKKVYTNPDSAERWTGYMGYYTAPAVVYDLNDTDSYWLLRNYRIVEDLGGYATTLEFLYNPDGWDTDIYTASSVSDEGL